jgi:tRNA pseudouridine13 synthase
MKLKCIAEDFQVVEQISLQPHGGRFALYTLTKQSLGTPEAIAAVVKRWGLHRSQIAFAGLKDRHALTQQYVTIEDGPKRELKQTSLKLEYIGQTERPVHAGDITANRFIVVLRDLSPQDAFEATSAIKQLVLEGLPNYFDEQRFGSLGESGEFIAKPWCLGDYERAMWLALADYNIHDRPADRQEKGTLRKHWGDWATCKRLLAGSRNLNLLSYLVANSTDFRRAITMLRQDLRSLYLAAFQSDLWNGMLSAVVQETCRPDQITPQTIGRREVATFRDLTPEQREKLAQTQLPLPSARLHLEDGPLKALTERVVSEAGLELRQVRVKYPRDSFFSKGDRPAVFRPHNLVHEGLADELFDQRSKLRLQFDLPRGAYATIVVKRLAGSAAFDVGEDED